MKYKLVVTDLDGTLFDSSAAVTEANAAALRAVADHGITIAIASGRRFGPFALKAAEAVGRPLFLILCNGAVIIDSDLKTLLFHKGINRNDVRWLVDIGCAKEGVHWNIHNDELDLLWRRSDGKPVVPDLPQDYWTPVTSTDELFALCSPDMLRVRFWASETEINALRKIITERGLAVEEYPYPGEGDSYMECMAPGISKTAAIEMLANRLGFGLEHVIAFGDGSNDVEMLGSVGLGVAMANATDAARRAAKMHTGSNDENGVAQAISRLFPEPVESFVKLYGDLGLGSSES